MQCRLFHPDDGGTTLLRNVGNYLPVYTAYTSQRTWITITTVMRNWHLTTMTPSHAIPSRNLPTPFGQCPCCIVPIIGIGEWSIEQQSASQLYIFLYSCSSDQRTNGHDFRFLQRYCRGFGSYGKWRWVFRCFPTFRKYCLHLQGLTGPRRPTSIKTPIDNNNNNNPATKRNVPEDMNA